MRVREFLILTIYLFCDTKDTENIHRKQGGSYGADCKGSFVYSG